MEAGVWERDERGRDRLTMAGAVGVWERDERGKDRLRQKLKSHLVGTQSLNDVPLKPAYYAHNQGFLPC